MAQSSKPIVLTGGGTAGHVIPCLALLPYLNSSEIHYIGSGGMEKSLTKNTGVIYHEIKPVKLIRELTVKNLGIPFGLIKSVNHCRKILDEIKPAVIFSKGGYVSLPVSLAAKNAPVILHESDKSLGLANRISLCRSQRLLTSFEGVNKKGEPVGSPIRREIYNGDKHKAIYESGLIQNGKPYLLVLGGSLGAKGISSAVITFLDELLASFNVVHIVGKGKSTGVKKTGYFEAEFIPNIHDYLALADFVLSRGGANTLFELVALSIPSLIIPLPTGRGDQIENADYFASRGCVKAVREEDLSQKKLPDLLGELRRDAPLLKENCKKHRSIDGTKKIAEIINSYL